MQSDDLTYNQLKYVIVSDRQQREDMPSLLRFVERKEKVKKRGFRENEDFVLISATS